MLAVERFPARDLFVGERILRLRNLPKRAAIKSARLILLPMTADGDEGVSVDPVVFDGQTTAETGETKTRVTSASAPWVELDFHGRRKLVQVTGSDLLGTTLQVDFGGTFVEINQNGAALAAGAPGPSGTSFTLSASPAALPGLVVPRMRITDPSGANAPDVSSILLSNAASNVTAGFAGEPSFWALPGEIAVETISTDFGAVLQAFLDQAQTVGDPVEVPIVLRSDTPGRLDAIVEVDFDSQVAPLGVDLAEVTLPFAYNGAPEADTDILTLEVPLGGRLIPEATHAHIVGRFENSKIILGPLERPNAAAAALELKEGMAAAQRFEVREDLSIDSVDVLVSTAARHARLQLDLRADLDGKPNSASLLTDRVELTIGNADTAAPRWVNAALPAALKATSADPLTGANRRLWLVVQSVEGGSGWHLASRADSRATALQSSDNGGLSWRQAGMPQAAGPPHEAELRLRQNTSEFNIPVEIEVSAGGEPRRISLEKFRPLGRVDFALDGVELANTINAVLDEAEQGSCPRGEQLLNPTFDVDGSPDPEIYSPAFWSVSGPAPDLLQSDIGISFLRLGDPDRPEEPSSISQMVPASPGCPYALSVDGLTTGPDSRVELNWRSSSCDVVRTDTLPLPEVSETGGIGLHPLTGALFATTEGGVPLLPTASLRVTAPEGINQVEVRLLSAGDTFTGVARLALTGAPQSVVNADFRRMEPGGAGFPGWTIDPDPASSGFDPVCMGVDGRIALCNETGLIQPIVVSQTIDVVPSAAFSFAFVGLGRATADDAGDPIVELLWLDPDGAVVGTPVQRPLGAEASDRQTAAGTVPESAARASIRLVLPDRTRIIVDHVEFVQRPITKVPVVLLSGAPGQATLRDVVVSFETVVPAPFAVPETGFCQPTPADRAPGDVCEIDEKTCAKEGAQPKARPATGLPGGPTPTERFVPARRRAAGLTARRLVSAPSGLPDVTVLTWIGPRREEILKRVGIRTIRDVADLSVAGLTRHIGVSQDLARSVINEARRLLGRPVIPPGNTSSITSRRTRHG